MSSLTQVHLATGVGLSLQGSGSSPYARDLSHRASRAEEDDDTYYCASVVATPPSTQVLASTAPASAQVRPVHGCPRPGEDPDPDNIRSGLVEVSLLWEQPDLFDCSGSFERTESLLQETRAKLSIAHHNAGARGDARDFRSWVEQSPHSYFLYFQHQFSSRAPYVDRLLTVMEYLLDELRKETRAHHLDPSFTPDFPVARPVVVRNRLMKLLKLRTDDAAASTARWLRFVDLSSSLDEWISIAIHRPQATLRESLDAVSRRPVRTGILPRSAAKSARAYARHLINEAGRGDVTTDSD
jgi:hypothetical protein